MSKHDKKIDAHSEQAAAETSQKRPVYEVPEPVDQFEEDMEFLKEADTMDAFVSMVSPD